MKKSLFLIGLLIFIMSFTGDAVAQKVRLRSQITPNCATTSNLKFADIYADGNIAVQGSYNCRGVFIYDITNPDAPVLASWYNPGANQQFLEAIVIGNRGYFGSGIGGGGVHIVDLTNPASPVLLGIVNSTNGGGHNSIHEMVVSRQNNVDYLIENFNSTTNKIIKVINVTNPAAAVFVRDISPTEVQWVHAMHIRGNRMFTSGWGNGANRAKTEIYDISNLGSQPPVLLGFIEDPSSTTAGNSMHSSWSSEDGNYLYSCRETNNGNGDVRVYNITNPAQPLLVNSLTMNGLNINAVTPHNPVVVGNYLYVAWYQAGVQIFDLTNPADPKRVGQYDTYPTAFAPSEAEKEAYASADPWDMICGSDFRQNNLPTSFDGNWAVFPQLGQNKILAGDLKFGLLILDATGVNTAPKNVVSDFDGDRKTDFSVFTPSTGQWFTESSSNGSFETVYWGLAGDVIVTGDYDGDGISDRAVWRPSNGSWYVYYNTGSIWGKQFGLTGDVPVPADYDADGKTDFAVWRPSNGTWYILQSTLGYKEQRWGLNGDKVLTGDYEGDGKADLVVWRPSNGTWYVMPSSSGIPIQRTWGLTGDKPLFADFDGDGRAEYTVYRPSNANWYVLNPATESYFSYRFGLTDDTPIPADYDGDGKADIAVYRQGTNVWYRLNSGDGAYSERQFGTVGDRPSPSSVQPQ